GDVAQASRLRSADELITIAGGVELEVTHKDGSKETVKVREIPATKIQLFTFATGWGKEAEQVAIYCDKPVEWTDTLTIASFNAIADKGLEINFDFFEAWHVRQAKWKTVL